MIIEREVTITVVAPVECTEEQFDEWVKFCTGYSGSISADNPLAEYDIEAMGINY